MFKLQTIIGKTNKYKLFLLLFFLIISSIFEFIGIGTIPILIGIVLDSSNFINTLNEYNALLKNWKKNNQKIIKTIFPINPVKIQLDP